MQNELGTAPYTLNGWNLATKQGKINIDPLEHMPQGVLNLVEKLNY